MKRVKHRIYFDNTKTAATHERNKHFVAVRNFEVAFVGGECHSRGRNVMEPCLKTGGIVRSHAENVIAQKKADSIIFQGRRNDLWSIFDRKSNICEPMRKDAGKGVKMRFCGKMWEYAGKCGRIIPLPRFLCCGLVVSQTCTTQDQQNLPHLDYTGPGAVANR